MQAKSAISAVGGGQNFEKNFLRRATACCNFFSQSLRENSNTKHLAV